MQVDIVTKQNIATHHELVSYGADRNTQKFPRIKLDQPAVKSIEIKSYELKEKYHSQQSLTELAITF